VYVGVVISIVSAAGGDGYVLVLDATTFQEIARVRFPYGLPYGFHGCWIPDKEKNSMRAARTRRWVRTPRGFSRLGRTPAGLARLALLSLFVLLGSAPDWPWIASYFFAEHIGLGI
jgi:hypothetical protein